MKRVISLVLVLAMCLSLCACSSESNNIEEVKSETKETEKQLFIDPRQEAFEISKKAYESVNEAYRITGKMGYDIYEAWRLGVNNKSEILDNPCVYLADNLTLDEDEIRMGVAYCNLTYLTGNDWGEMPEDVIEQNFQYSDNFFYWDKYPLFSICIWVVSSAYHVNDDVAIAQKALSDAKTQMKRLTTDYSDYEHIPNLKDYYTVVNSYLDYCIKPTGTFNQAKDTFSDYENRIREYQNDLDFIFED